MRPSTTLGLNGIWPALILLVASSAAAQQFSADEIVHHADGSETRAKVYVSHPKIRVENQGKVLIVDLEKQRTWMLLTANKKFIEQTGPAALQPIAFFAPKDGKPCQPAAHMSGRARSSPRPVRLQKGRRRLPLNRHRNRVRRCPACSNCLR